MARRPDTRSVTRSVTLRDIARRTGFHESTVSRALNARTRHLVAADAAARIVATARELGYRPNYMAAALRTRRSMRVGLVVDDLADATTAATLAAIEAALRDAGYTLTVIATGGEPARLAAAIATLDGHGADGAILLDRPPPLPTDDARRLPLVDAVDLRQAGAAAGHRAAQRLLARLADDATAAGNRRPDPC